MLHVGVQIDVAFAFALSLGSRSDCASLFSSDKVRLCAHVFTAEVAQSELLKRDYNLKFHKGRFYRNSRVKL